MCGINGYIQMQENLSKNQIETLIHKMNQLIFHRGPDDNGVYINDNIGLGMRRLSIIDLSMGNQPVFNEDKSLVIVFNGEIYNYKSLKKDLIIKGHVFSTASDTEVVIHCYEEYGNQCFDKLKGMFAFAIYDIKRNKLIIARDRIGEKPLYYCYKSGVFLFASELKSIISTGLMDKKIDRNALNQYLQLTYIPAPLTIFENVNKLLPGHYLEVDIQGNLKIEQYWNVTYNDSKLCTDYNQCKSKLRETLFNAVEECMVSDVPLGAFLSGGIDSTIIVGIMSQLSKDPIQTFTIGYKDKQFDESDRARSVAKLHQTDHHIYYLDYDEALPELDKLLSNIDEPFSDSSYIPTYMISKYAKQNVKVVLTGDAGDELFGGYSKYLIGYYAEKYNRLPAWIRENLVRKTAYLLPDNTSFTRKMKKVIENSNKSVYTQRRNLMCLGFKEEELSHLLVSDMIEPDSTDFIRDYYEEQMLTNDELSRALYTDMKVVLEGDMLPKVDRASMLSSLETRVPMLYKDVVEMAAMIPSEYKINAKKQKIILKDTFSDLIPKELLHASKKGFGVPVGKWFQNELKNELISTLSEERIKAQGIFNSNYIANILDEHFTLKKNRSNELWTLYVFQKWYQKYFND